MGKTAGKPPLHSLQSPLGALHRQTGRILPCCGLRLLTKLACRRRPRHRQSHSQGRASGLSRLADDGTEGRAPSELLTHNSCYMSIRPSPPLYKSSTGLPLPHSVDGPFHVTSPSIFFSLLCSVFPDEPGQGLKLRPRQCFARCAQWPPSRTIHCRRAKRLRGEDAVPCGLSSATTP